MRKKMLEFYKSLPKELRVLPYILLSGAVVALIDYLSTFEVNNAFYMGIINLAIVFLKERYDKRTS
jgi:hypothetical protein